MADRHITDEALASLRENFQDHPVEAFYVSYREGDPETERLATQVKQALRMAGWNAEPDIVADVPSIRRDPGVEVEASAESPEGNVSVLVEWLTSQGLDPAYNFNPGLDHVAIHVNPQRRT